MDQKVIRKVMIQMYKNFISEGKTDEAAKALIINIEPFNLFPEFLETMGKNYDSAGHQNNQDIVTPSGSVTEEQIEAAVDTVIAIPIYFGVDRECDIA